MIEKIIGNHCQFSCLKIRRNTVLIIMTPTTPHAYIEWSLLISRSGSFEGTAAMTGEINTSARPLDAENIIVPITSPTYTADGKTKGDKANTISPIAPRTGVNLTTFEISNLCEKNEKIRSTVNCVEKLIRTNSPKYEYDIS